MSELRIPSEVLHAARLFAAPDKETRYYLRSVHFNRKDARIEATNSHMAVIIPFNFEAQNDYSVDNSLHRIPTGHLGKTCVLDGNTLAIYADAACKVLKSQIILDSSDEAAAGAYPNMNLVLPPDGRTHNCGHFGLDATYLALLEKAFGKHRHMIFHVSDPDRVVKICPVFPDEHPLYGTQALIMPVRI